MTSSKCQRHRNEKAQRPMHLSGARSEFGEKQAASPTRQRGAATAVGDD